MTDLPIGDTDTELNGIDDDVEDDILNDENEDGDDLGGSGLDGAVGSDEEGSFEGEMPPEDIGPEISAISPGSKSTQEQEHRQGVPEPWLDEAAPPTRVSSTELPPPGVTTTPVGDKNLPASKGIPSPPVASSTTSVAPPPPLPPPQAAGLTTLTLADTIGLTANPAKVQRETIEAPAAQSNTSPNAVSSAPSDAHAGVSANTSLNTPPDAPTTASTDERHKSSERSLRQTSVHNRDTKRRSSHPTHKNASGNSHKKTHGHEKHTLTDAVSSGGYQDDETTFPNVEDDEGEQQNEDEDDFAGQITGANEMNDDAEDNTGIEDGGSAHDFGSEEEELNGSTVCSPRSTTSSQYTHSQHKPYDPSAPTAQNAQTTQSSQLPQPQQTPQPQPPQLPDPVNEDAEKMLVMDDIQLFRSMGIVPPTEPNMNMSLRELKGIVVFQQKKITEVFGVGAMGSVYSKFIKVLELLNQHFDPFEKIFGYGLRINGASDAIENNIHQFRVPFTQLYRRYFAQMGGGEASPWIQLATITTDILSRVHKDNVIKEARAAANAARDDPSTIAMAREIQQRLQQQQRQGTNSQQVHPHVVLQPTTTPAAATAASLPRLQPQMGLQNFQPNLQTIASTVENPATSIVPTPSAFPSEPPKPIVTISSTMLQQQMPMGVQKTDTMPSEGIPSSQTQPPQRNKQQQPSDDDICLGD